MQVRAKIVNALSSAETLLHVFEWLSIGAGVLTVAALIGIALTSRIVSRQNKMAFTHVEKDLAEAKTRQAEAELELAKINPLNLPITSIRADVWLMVRADFFEWYFKDDPVLKGGSRAVSVCLASKTGALVIMRCNEFESLIWKEEGQSDGRTFQMSFAWPAGDWFSAQEVKYWVERTNASTAMLDKELVGAVISLPPTKDEKPVQILQSSCRVTINGSIRRNFVVPKSSATTEIFCPVKTD